MTDELRVPHSPISVVWEVTRRCNLACLHCYVRHGRFYTDELSTREALSLIRELDRVQVFHVTLTGGEPTLRRDFVKIVKELKDRNFQLSLITNGTVCERDKVRFIAKNFDFIKVSLDAPCRELHDKIRGKEGAFELTLNFIKMLNDFGANYTVACTLNRLNVEYVREFITFAIKVGIKCLSFGFVTPFNFSEEERSMLLSPSEVFHVRRLLWDLRKSHRDIIDISVNFCEMLERIPSLDNFIKTLKEKRKTFRYPCGAGITACAINSRGDVIPCIILDLEEFKWGNVKFSNLEDIWKSERAEEWRRNMINIPSKCKKCLYLPLCRTSCRASSLLFTGNIDGLHPYCPREFLDFLMKHEFKVKESTVYRKSRKVRWRDDYEYVSIAIKRKHKWERVYLNETASKIWHEIDGEKTVREIIDKLSKEYDASPEEIRADVLNFIRELERVGLVVPKPGFAHGECVRSGY